MNEVNAIKEKRIINRMQKQLLKQNYRDYLLFYLGISFGLRISDLRKITVSDVNGDELKLKEKKTGKNRRLWINEEVKFVLEKYTIGKPDDEYLFKSQKGDNLPITRQRAYEILNSAWRAIGQNGTIGTHTMRKTYGYLLYKNGISLSLICKLLNHRDESTTLAYIGITNEDKEDCYKMIGKLMPSIIKNKKLS